MTHIITGVAIALGIFSIAGLLWWIATRCTRTVRTNTAFAAE